MLWRVKELGLFRVNFPKYALLADAPLDPIQRPGSGKFRAEKRSRRTEFAGPVLAGACRNHLMLLKNSLGKTEI